MKFNEKLIELRKQYGLSQEALGYELNVTRQTISKWELGVSTPEMDKLVELSKYFNISLDVLINESINLNNPSSNTTSSNQTINPEFVGISSEYIPEDVKTKTYVSEPTKRTKALYYAFPIIFLILMITMPIIMFSKHKQHSDNISNDFFNRASNLLSNQQEKADSMIKDSQENPINKIENLQNNINNKNEDTPSTNSDSKEIPYEIRIFNQALEIKKGTTSASFINWMFDDIIDKPEEVKEIVVVYNDIKADSKKEWLDLQEHFRNVRPSTSKNYVLSFEYADEGYINKVIIKDK